MMTLARSTVIHPEIPVVVDLSPGRNSAIPHMSHLPEFILVSQQMALIASIPDIPIPTAPPDF